MRGELLLKGFAWRKCQRSVITIASNLAQAARRPGPGAPASPSQRGDSESDPASDGAPPVCNLRCEESWRSSSSTGGGALTLAAR
jgi:hypothetical protein